MNIKIPDLKHLSYTSKKAKALAQKKDPDDPCWEEYEMVGLKKKKGKKVPNCVKIK